MAKVERINKNNFEKYLLDFEEGRLDEKMSEALLYFMETNHLLEDDHESAFVLHADLKVALLAETKQNLIQLDTESEAITESNIHYYLNSKIEGLLDQRTNERLNDFLNKHSEYRNELELLENIKLIPDASIKYPAKSQLKQKQTKSIWPIIAAAACFVGLLISGLNFNNESLKASAVKNIVKQQNDTLNSNETQNQNPIIKKNLTQTKWKEFMKESMKMNLPEVQNYLPLNEEVVDTLDLRENKFPELRQVVLQMPEEVLISSTSTNPLTPIKQSQQVLMNNPIHPITSGLSYLTQKEIDFRMANNETQKKGRYFLKIGKLEILHIEN
jgi:hypothetical protein